MYTYICARVRMYVRVYACMCACTHVCARVRMYVRRLEPCTSAVVLNRGCTYHLGVRGAKAGGTKHQSLHGYTFWKFKPDFIEHSS